MQEKPSGLGAAWLMMGGLVLQFASGAMAKAGLAYGEPYGYIVHFLIYLVLITLSVGLLCGAMRVKPADCRIIRPRLSLRGIVVAFALPGTFILINMALFPGEIVNNHLPPHKVVNTLAYLFFYTGFSSGITEEVMFRGVMMSRAERSWGKIIGMLVPAVLFGCMHGLDGSLWSVLLRMSDYITISVLLSVVTYQSGQVWDAALIHALWNALYSHQRIFNFGRHPDDMAIFSYVMERNAIPAWVAQANASGHLRLIVLLVCWLFILVLCATEKIRGRPVLGPPLPELADFTPQGEPVAE